MLGKERVIEADLLGTKAHVFTDAPREFEGVLGNLLATTPSSSGDRALLVAALNAALKRLDLITGVLHCRGEEPEACASEIAGIVRAYWGNASVGLVGLNPALLESLVARFGSQNVRAIDLNRGNVGTTRWGVEIGDGMTDTEKLVRFSDIVLIAGTTVVNGSLDAILGLIRSYHKGYLVYGVTVAGVSHLMDLPRICPYGKG
jgi:hypothetical protein